MSVALKGMMAAAPEKISACAAMSRYAGNELELGSPSSESWYTSTSSAGRANGCGRTNTASTKVNIAALAPIPRPMMTTAVTLKTGALTSRRAAVGAREA